MMELAIVYNSFGPLTDIKLDGKLLKAHSEEAVFLDQHRQIAVFDWLGKLVELLNSKYRKTIRISFVGTADDCETFRTVVADIAKMLPGDSVRIGDVSASLPDPLNALDCIYQKGKDGPFPEIFTDKATEAAYKRATARAFEVSVIAAMSSGKSTLMNALLGRNLMPSAADACTATIVRITDTDSMKGQPFLAVRYGADGKPKDKDPIEVTNADLVEWNNDKSIPHVEICGDVPTISETKSAQYVFQDTPGPNNSTDDSHREMTNQAIAKPLSMVLYVMTPDTFQSNDNDGIFRSVCQAVKKADGNARNRFIFVLNKIDAVKSKEQSVEDVYRKACAYLEGKGIGNPIVIPVCARAACLMRLHRYDISFFEGNDDDCDEYSMSVSKFSRPAWNMYNLCKGVLSSSVQRQYEKRLAAASGQPEELALLQTGIPLLETILQEYLYRYALPTKVGDALKTFRRVFDEADKVAEVHKILSMKEGDLKKFAQELADSEKSKATLMRGEEIIKSIGQIEYKISDNSKDELEELSKTYETELDDAIAKLGSGKVPADTANAKCERVRTKLDGMVEDVKEKLSEVLESEQKKEIGDLVDQYNKCLKDSLGKLNPALRDFQSDMLSISSEEILQTAKNQAETYITHTHYERHWYTLWCYKHEETTYEDAVDMSKVAVDVRTELADFCRSAIVTFKKQALASFKNNQKRVLDRMDELQEKLKNTIKQIHDSAKNKATCAAECTKLQAQLDWCEAFSQELSGVLRMA